MNLRLLAEQIVTEFVDLAPREQPPDRAAYDNRLLTAGRRIGSAM